MSTSTSLCRRDFCFSRPEHLETRALICSSSSVTRTWILRLMSQAFKSKPLANCMVENAHHTSVLRFLRCEKYIGDRTWISMTSSPDWLSRAVAPDPDELRLPLPIERGPIPVQFQLSASYLPKWNDAGNYKNEVEFLNHFEVYEKRGHTKEIYPFFIFITPTKVIILGTELILQITDVFVTHFQFLNFFRQLNIFLSNGRTW